MLRVDGGQGRRGMGLSQRWCHVSSSTGGAGNKSLEPSSARRPIGQKILNCYFYWCFGQILVLVELHPPEARLDMMGKAAGRGEPGELPLHDSEWNAVVDAGRRGPRVTDCSRRTEPRG